MILSGVHKDYISWQLNRGGNLSEILGQEFPKTRLHVVRFIKTAPFGRGTAGAFFAQEGFDVEDFLQRQMELSYMLFDDCGPVLYSVNGDYASLQAGKLLDRRAGICLGGADKVLVLRALEKNLLYPVEPSEVEDLSLVPHDVHFRPA